MTQFKYVIEELAIDELEKQEELARKTSSSHLLAFDIEESSKAQQAAKEPEAGQATQPTQDAGSQDANAQDAGSQDGSTQTGQSAQEPAAQDAGDESQKAQEPKKSQKSQDGEKNKSEDGKDKDKAQDTEEPVSTPQKAQVASEAYILPKAQIAKEYMDDQELGSKTLDFMKWFGMLGLKYGLVVLKNVGSAVLFTAVHLVKFLFTSMGDLKDYISRRFDSYEDLQHQLVALHKSLDSVKKDKAEGSYTSVKVIDQLKIGSSVDLKANNKAFSSFMNNTMSVLVKSSLDDFAQTMNFVQQDLGTVNAKPSNILKLKELGSIVKPGNLEGYTDIPENTHSLISDAILPGDVKLMLVVPVNGIADEDAYVKAYQHSYTALVADTSSYKHANSIAYLSKSELKAYLEELNKLMLACIEHKKLFEQLMSSKMKLRYSFKAYLNQIFHSSNKLDVKTSLIELIYVKTIFAEKVYIKGSMDIHDFAVRVLKANIKFAQDNLTHLQ